MADDGTGIINSPSNTQLGEGAGDFTPYLRSSVVRFEDKYGYVKPLGSGGEAICDRYHDMDTHKAVAVKSIATEASAHHRDHRSVSRDPASLDHATAQRW
ncbi:hypothetical protein AAFC00_003481 [Neodothiora populina]|uniref:Uncharacterized protein n=1 Tax=Neodothiora populina TaxID=2781224 RepID=A0ABR3PEK7_9PEZI